MSSLPPANEVCEGYVFTGVCLSTGDGGGGCLLLVPGRCLPLVVGRGYLPHTPLGRPGQTPPGRHPPGRYPPGRHPQADTPHPRILRDTVNKWAVGIPLECILVIVFIHLVKVSFISDIPYLGPMPNLFLGEGGGI